MVVTSSIMSFMVNPGGATYSSTKAFVSNFFEGVHFEVSDKVDVLNWHCGGVHTKFLSDVVGEKNAKNLTSKQGCVMVSPKRAVTAMFKDIGRSRMTTGAMSHGFMVWVINTFYQPCIWMIDRLVFT